MSNFSIRHRKSRRAGLLVGLLVCMVLVGAAGAIAYRFYLDQQADIDASQLITQLASRGPFDHIVAEQGEIESSSKTEIVCEVKSRGTGGVSILWAIDEGTHVQPGDKLVELDASELEQRLKEKRIKVITAEAKVATAEAVREQAKISRQEYLEGVFVTEEKAIKSEQAIAEQDLRKAQLALASSVRLVAKGLIKKLQTEADRFALSRAQNKLDADTNRLRVLNELTLKKMLVQFDSDIDAAVASLSATRSELLEEETELQEIEDQISKCVMLAPSAGVVVHANKYSSRGGSSEFVVEAGSTVRERQTIIFLPDPSKMQVKCKVNESRITLIKEGMPARITVDAIPGLKLTGLVTKVNRYAEPGSWMNSSTKEYATYIEIIDPPEEIRTGMTSDVHIFVEQLDNTVQIPIQGLYEHGDEMYSLRQTGPSEFETVKVTMRATNDTMASIDDGINENDRIVLNLRQHLLLMDLPDVQQEDNTELRKLGAIGAKAQKEAKPSADEVAVHQGQRKKEGARTGAPREGRRMPDVNTIVASSMKSNDTDGDGTLSPEEIGKIDQQWRGMIKRADANSDGSVSRAELTTAIKKRFSGGGAR